MKKRASSSSTQTAMLSVRPTNNNGGGDPFFDVWEKKPEKSQLQSARAQNVMNKHQETLERVERSMDDAPLYVEKSVEDESYDIDLSDEDELRKAIIYSEVFNRKF